jgi:hypothetical protein
MIIHLPFFLAVVGDMAFEQARSYRHWVLDAWKVEDAGLLKPLVCRR